MYLVLHCNVKINIAVDEAVEIAHGAVFSHQGQICCAGSRTFVHESIYDEFVKKAVARASKRTVGDPFTKVEQGPQVLTNLSLFKNVLTIKSTSLLRLTNS